MRHRKGRVLLTSIGILLGVAILFGVLVSNDSTNAGLEMVIEDFTGRADVLVTPTGSFDATFPNEVVGRLADLPEVADAVGSYTFGGTVSTPDLEEPERVRVAGVVLEQEAKIHDFVLESGRVFERDKNEALLPKQFARMLGVSESDRFQLATVGGFREFEVVGILDDKGAGRVAQGDVVFTSIETARRVNLVGGVVRIVSIVLDDGTDIQTWIDDHKDDVGEGFDFENAETLAQDFRNFLTAVQAGFTTFAAMALFVGAFLIYLTLTSAVVERTRMYGTLRALGSTRGQIRRMVISEALLMGIVSTIAGIGLGLLLASGMLQLTSNLFDLEFDGLTIRAAIVALSMGVGMTVTFLSSVIPAVRASRMSPVEAIRGSSAAKRRLSSVWVGGAVVAGTGIFLTFTSESVFLRSASTFLVLLGSVLMIPLLLRPLALVLGWITKRISRGAGDIAVFHLVKERSRSAYTLGLIMAVMAMTFANGGIQSSFAASIDSVMDQVFGADLTVNPRGVRFEESVVDEVMAINGVQAATAVQFVSASLKREPGAEESFGLVYVVDPKTYFDVESFANLELTETSARQALSTEDSVLISGGLAESSKKSIGDKITLRTSKGQKDFLIADTFLELMGPSVAMGVDAAKKHLEAGLPQSIHLNLATGVSVSTMKDRIEGQLEDRYHLDFQTAADAKAEANDVLGQYINIFLAILLVAAVIGLLGLANTLAMSVSQRIREIGILRAVGTTRGQVRRMVLVESLTLGLVAFVLSLPLGWLLSQGAVSGSRALMGFRIEYVYPATWVPGVAVLGASMAVLAALIPARRAARLDVVEALRFE